MNLNVGHNRIFFTWAIISQLKVDQVFLLWMLIPWNKKCVAFKDFGIRRSQIGCHMTPQ